MKMGNEATSNNENQFDNLPSMSQLHSPNLMCNVHANNIQRKLLMMNMINCNPNCPSILDIKNDSSIQSHAH